MLVLVLSGCTAGSAAGPGPATGIEPPAVSGEPAVSVSPSPDPIGGGPVLTVEALPFAEPSDAALPAPRRQALQQALDETVRDSTRVPGVTAAVLSPAGAWTGAAGVDGAGTALVPEATFDIASITKTFTAAEVLLLAGRHRIDLDAPASTYLDHPLLARGPTVRQLLSHTSGIPDFGNPNLFDAIDADPARSWTAGQVLELRHRPAQSARAAGDVLQQQQLPAARPADREGDRPELRRRGAPRPAARVWVNGSRCRTRNRRCRRWPHRT